MHNDARERRPMDGHGGEATPVNTDNTQRKQVVNSGSQSPNIQSTCTEICGSFSGRSCAKIVMVYIYHERSQHPPIKVYALLDEQSNKSLAKPELFDIFDAKSQCENYNLTTCSGITTVSGRRSHGFVVQSLDRNTELRLPTLIECEAIPENRREIPTKDVAIHYSHLSAIADFIPDLDGSVNILLLIGRDLLSAHYVLDQKRGTTEQPYAQLLPLGWVIIGETCLDGRHVPTSVDVMKTALYESSTKPSIMPSCSSKMHVSELITDQALFHRTEDDNKPGMSVEDRTFIALMDRNMKKDPSGHWIAPLPFKGSRPSLPNNRKQALDRAIGLDKSLRRNPTKEAHFLEFMRGLFEADHAEQASELAEDAECWYLPLFGVYHPQKKDKIRGVFDSSALFNNVSLNEVLMSGPDLMNNLLGVLLRFRKEPIAIMADIEHMFHCFLVNHEHRRYLRFIWHRDNDMDQPLIDYQMKVHVFGNKPSPAVATYGLRRTADEAEHQYGSDMRNFVHHNFYVDDALSSHSTVEEAIDLLRRTQKGLQEYGSLRLHKISSNSAEVLAAFDSEDLAKNLKTVELWNSELPTQRSLGVCWNLQGDHFFFKVNMEDKPFTRRGVLSSINSLFDPLGFVAPVTIAGKNILRNAMVSGIDWDEPLPQEFLHKWIEWKSTLKDLESLQIPCTFASCSLSMTKSKDLLIFSDASEMAIASVAYLRTTLHSGEQHIGFIIGKAKLAPKHGHTVPRLELCAAVMATELYSTIKDELDIQFDSVNFYTDSKVVIGYIQNQTKRFFTYVANRVEKIRRCSEPGNWNYVPSKHNPADEGTRSISVKDMQGSLWLNGPLDFLDVALPDIESDFCEDTEVVSNKTEVLTETSLNLDTSRLDIFSDWSKMIRVLTLIRQTFLRKLVARSRVDDMNTQKPISFRQTEHYVISVFQREHFENEINALSDGKPVPKCSTIYDLDPYLDESGLLRVGGRLRRSDLAPYEKNPIIIPKKSLIASLLVDYFHKRVKHQGRLLTQGAIRNGGFWIIGCRRLINSYIQSCITCRKLRGQLQQPKMADLPEVRLQPAPPFSYIGVDVFGPWEVVTRSTRNVKTRAKRWAVIFTCMIIRAIHIEIIEGMTTSCFINALRRFTSLRGEVRRIYSDCGTNFVGATSEMNVNVINVRDDTLQKELDENGIQWIFNPPHASHMGGSWERLIGVSRRILEALLSDPKVTKLTHEVLITFMAEVCAIVNARPLTGVPSDPELPFPLTPATLLTLKTKHIVDSFDMDNFHPKDLYKDQWRCVQYLSNCFWKRWKGEYLSILQSRKKWQQDTRSLQVGDIVLLRDKTLHRNDWPVGIVQSIDQSDDNRVRRIQVRTGKDNKVFSRPSTEVVLLIAMDE
ncbi:hypothetical protein FSP39_005210 [Pinctada imbricata]|uniref:Integrase catalytic domain-containing protein n=1 Tax=Pinctada imbricata TaxID=66713 RepID=A0AA88XL33_PINIB|nr:hypothetical protein FSP39_005210 [Pinctada imbricata]